MTSKITNFALKNSRWIAAWTSQFCNSKMLKAANIRKARGATVGTLLRLLLAAPFGEFSIWRQAGPQAKGPYRDAFYRFLGHPSYNWRRLLLAAARRLIEELDRLTGPRGDRVLILDESPYKRDRSKSVQLLGSHYDCNAQCYYRGFRMLTLGWSDGHSFIPQQMELLTNRSSGKRIGPDTRLDGRSHGAGRSQVALQKTPAVAAEMVARSAAEEAPADYLVADSWFAQPGLLITLSESLPVVCRLKNHPNILYCHGKRIYTLKRLYSKVLARKRSNPKGPIIGSITVRMLSGPKLRVVFIRDQKDSTRWIALASTDTEITPGRVCRIYAKRWAIEVFFKQVKQQLGLACEVQVRSYTACVAHTSIVFLRYMMLAYYRRQQIDERTIPGLFFAACRELQALSMGCCLQIILLEWLSQASRSGYPRAFETACQICGIAEQFVARLTDNSIIFNPLHYNCES